MEHILLPYDYQPMMSQWIFMSLDSLDEMERHLPDNLGKVNLERQTNTNPFLHFFFFGLKEKLKDTKISQTAETLATNNIGSKCKGISANEE